MFKDTVKSALSSLVPIWSNEIVRSFSLGTEYTMAITMILAETITFLSGLLNDTVSVFLIFIISIFIFLNFFGIKIISTANFIKSCKSITVIGTEKYGANETSLLCSKAFKAVNLMLINKYEIKKLRYLKDGEFDIVVDDIVDHKLEPDLFVTVKRDPKDTQKITITLLSYNMNLNAVISDAINTYDDGDKLYKLKLVGNELNGTSYDYPEAMKYLTYVLVNNYKMSKLKILSETKKPDYDTGLQNNDLVKAEIKNANKRVEETRVETVDDFGKNIKNVFLLESCKNYKLENDVFITIERVENMVTYTLFSNSVDLKDFLKKCINIYKTGICIKDYKYVLKLSGLETTSSHRTQISYPKNFIALCDKLISGGHVNNFRMVDIDKKPVRIIDDLSNIMVDNILLNSVKSVQSPSSWEKYVYTTYILESNTVDLTEYIENCVKEYDIRSAKKNDGIIYYFKYLGQFGKEIRFSKTILSSASNQLDETFDNIYNEHSDRLKKDICQLKNTEYYRRTGLRKKKAYMFYGEPGCGKNASVVAMALYDNRHIVDIPFSILQYNSEFYEIMNLTTIEGVSFEKHQIIYMFDEMHVGLSKITKGILSKQNKEKDNDTSKQEFMDKFTQNAKEPTEKMSHDTLDMSCILSLLDGIGNYGGVIYVGLTNYIEQIPEPLKRSLRLTPIYFTYLRRCDIVKLLEKFFGLTLSPELILGIPDRKITPARLRVLCEQNDEMSIQQFVELLIHESAFESRENYCDTDNTEKYLNVLIYNNNEENTDESNNNEDSENDGD